MRSFLGLADFLLAAAKVASIVLMGAMTVSILIGVFFRYVIAAPIAWPPEAARFMMVAITMIAGSVAVRQLDHVGITFLVDRIPRWLRLACYLVGATATAVFLALLLYYGQRFMLEAGPRQVSPSLGLSYVVVLASLPLGALLMLVQLVAAVVEGVARARAGGSPFGAGQAA